MSKKRQHQPVVKTWYHNLDEGAKAFRKIRTASGRRNIRISSYKNSSQEKIKEEPSEHDEIEVILDNYFIRRFHKM